MTHEERLKNLIDALKRLRLSGVRTECIEILQKAEMEKMTYLEFLEEIVRRELASRKKNKMKTCIRQAGLTEKYSLDDFQLPEGYGLNAFELKVLEDLLWVDHHYNLFVIGAHGTGKSKLAKGITTKAFSEDKRAYYISAASLVETLEKKDLEPSCKRRYEIIRRCQLLVIDDIDEVSMGPQVAIAFKVLMEQFKGRCSVMITASRPIKEWKKVFYDESFGVSIVDRLKKRSEIITLNATSFRITLHEGFFSKFAKGDNPDQTPEQH